MLLLALLFAWFPPLTSFGGLLALLAVPAALTRWITLEPDAVSRNPIRPAFVAVAAATLAAGLYSYYRFAPVPRSFGDYLLAVGPAPLTGGVAALVAWIVRRTWAMR